MTVEGGCYCGGLRYQATGDAVFKGQCHCRECQYISGGHPNVVMAMPEGGFSYTKGSPKQFRRSDLADPVTREFCADCGTHILTRTPKLPGTVLIKVGTFDDPSPRGHTRLRARARLSPGAGLRSAARGTQLPARRGSAILSPPCGGAPAHGRIAEGGRSMQMEDPQAGRRSCSSPRSAARARTFYEAIGFDRTGK
jgi:hypothetical protein